MPSFLSLTKLWLVHYATSKRKQVDVKNDKPTQYITGVRLRSEQPSHAEMVTLGSSPPLTTPFLHYINYCHNKPSNTTGVTKLPYRYEMRATISRVQNPYMFACVQVLDVRKTNIYKFATLSFYYYKTTVMYMYCGRLCSHRIRADNYLHVHV